MKSDTIFYLCPTSIVLSTSIFLEYWHPLLEMPGRPSRQDRQKLGMSKALRILGYLDHLKPEQLVCYWNNGEHKDAHGDNKANTLGIYTMSTMKTSNEPSKYLVDIKCFGISILNFDMPCSSTQPPTSQEVMAAIAIELKKCHKIENIFHSIPQ